MSEIKRYFVSRFGEDGYVMECDLCLALGTRVLTHDFHHVPIEEVEIGDYLVGFGEKLKTYGGTEFKKSKVHNKKTINKESLKLHFDDGTSVVCSKDHMWVARQKRVDGALRWVTSSDFVVGDYIPQITDVWPSNYSTDDAWMGGFLDGDGWLSHASTFAVGQKRDPHKTGLWNKFEKILGEDFPAGLGYNLNNTGVWRVQPYGLRTAWTACGKYRPVRLLEQLQKTYPGTIMRSKRNRKRTIIQIEDVGVQEVVALETSTKTYIAEGMPSHNCQIEIVVQAFLSGDPQLNEDIHNGVCVHSKRLSQKLGEDYEKVYHKAKVEKDPWYEAQRQGSKSYSFERAFGAGINTIAKNNNMPVEDVKKLVEAERQLYPGIEAIQQQWIEEVQHSREPTTYRSKLGHPIGKGTLVGVNGRRFTFWEEDAPDFMREKGYDVTFKPTMIKNYPIQGFAADIIKLVCGKVFRLLNYTCSEWRRNIKFINTVHDNGMNDTHKDYLNDSAWVLKTTMENVPKLIEEAYGIKFDLPVNCELTYGPNWKEQYDLDFDPTRPNVLDY